MPKKAKYSNTHINMKHLFTCVVLALPLFVVGQTTDSVRCELAAQQRQIASLRQDVRHLRSDLATQAQDLAECHNTLSQLQVQMAKESQSHADSLHAMRSDVQQTMAETGANIHNISTAMQSSLSLMKWGGAAMIVLLIVGLICIVLYARKRVKRLTARLSEIDKAQGTLKDAQEQLQEQNVALDTKVLEALDRQIAAPPVSEPESEADHSLVLKIADEVTRIEVNLSRMDATIRGHKQLTRAVQRIKDNFLANGYEIVEMLGKPYIEGMQVIADIIPDETMPKGARIITNISKPQVNYNGKMIQAAQITVSQNI